MKTWRKVDVKILSRLAALDILTFYSLFLVSYLFSRSRACRDIGSSSMSTSAVLRTAFAGAIFGAALTASGVYSPSVIIDQLRLKNFHMLQAFLTASASSALVVHVLERFGYKRPTRPNATLHWFSHYDANILGGVMIGIGMSLSGACPGTLFVQLGQGIPTSLYTALGAIIGGTAWAKYGRISKGEPVTIPEKLKLDPSVVLLAFEALCATAVGVVSQETTLLPVAGGLLIGLAQAVSMLISGSPLGCSLSYEQIGHLILGIGDTSRRASAPLPPMNVIFGIGIVGGSLSLKNHVPWAPAATQIPIPNAILGGCLLGVGGRLAGGCTSGHGITGLSALSFSSLITVASMFAGGIASALLMY